MLADTISRSSLLTGRTPVSSEMTILRVNILDLPIEAPAELYWNFGDIAKAEIATGSGT